MSSSVSRNVDYIKVVDALADVVKELNRGGDEFADPACAAATDQDAQSAAHAAAAEHGATADKAPAKPAKKFGKDPVPANTVFVTFYNLSIGGKAATTSASGTFKISASSTKDAFMGKVSTTVSSMIDTFHAWNQTTKEQKGTTADAAKAVKNAITANDGFAANRVYQFACYKSLVPRSTTGATIFELDLHVSGSDTGIPHSWRTDHESGQKSYRL